MKSEKKYTNKWELYLRDILNKPKRIQEWKSTVNELKDGRESINRKQQTCIHYSRMDRAENSICSVEDRAFYITSQREIKRSENSQCDIWNIIKRNSQWTIAVPEREEREGRESLFKEIMANDFPNLGRVLDIQFHEAHRSPSKSSENFSRTLLIELSKPKKDY